MGLLAAGIRGQKHDCRKLSSLGQQVFNCRDQVESTARGNGRIGGHLVLYVAVPLRLNFRSDGYRADACT